MQVKYIARDLRDIKITPDIESSVEKKLTQRLKKYSQNNQEQNITVRVSEKKPRIRIDIEMMYLNYRLHAESEVTSGEGILGGVEKCLDIIDRQIEKYRTKMHSRTTRKSIKSGLPAANAVNYEDYEDEQERKIIKVENYELTPMNVDEAVLQLEMLDYRFLFFHNIESDSPCVVYKRDDGNIGLMEE